MLQVEKIDGILIYRFEAPLHFANVGVFKSRLQKVSGVQLGKKKGNFADSDGFLPKLLRKVKCVPLCLIMHVCVYVHNLHELYSHTYVRTHVQYTFTHVREVRTMVYF